MDYAALAQHILDTHHALLHRELPRLTAAFQDAPIALRDPWSSFHDLMRDHLFKEERILFPAIFALSRGEPLPGCGVEGPTRQMSYEHTLIGALEDRLRAVAHLAGAEQDALVFLLDDLKEHARVEDEALFPAVQAAATSATIPS